MAQPGFELAEIVLFRSAPLLRKGRRDVLPSQTGRIVAGLGTSCVELDHALRVVSEPGKSLAEGSLASYALGLAVTPGGTVILKPAQGRDLWRVGPGGAAPQKIPTGLEVGK